MLLLSQQDHTAPLPSNLLTIGKQTKKKRCPYFSVAARVVPGWKLMDSSKPETARMCYLGAQLHRMVITTFRDRWPGEIYFE